MDGKEVSANFFRTLGVRLAAGRGFSAEEDRIGGAPAVVIGNRLWQDRFAGSLAALGRNISLNGVDHTIVGILGPRFGFGNQAADVYTPIARRYPLYINDRTVHDILCVGRLRPGVSTPPASAFVGAGIPRRSNWLRFGLRLGTGKPGRQDSYSVAAWELGKLPARSHGPKDSQLPPGGRVLYTKPNCG